MKMNPIPATDLCNFSHKLRQSERESRTDDAVDDRMGASVAVRVGVHVFTISP